MTSLTSLKRHVVATASVSTALAMLASCGSRTGLFVEVPSPDASLDAPFLPDAPVDARPDVDAAVDAPIDAPLPCLPGTFVFKLATAQIMFVLDRSGSMAYSLSQDVIPPPGRPSRWTALREALSTTIVPLDNQVAMGAKFFPEANADAFDAVQACITNPGVGIAPALGNAQTILGIFDTTSPVGGTPTAAAVQTAATYVSQSRGVARVMVLATDGQPNCNGALDGKTCICTSQSTAACTDDPQGGYNCLDDIATTTVIGNAFQNQGIPTYVIGIGGDSFGAVLNKMAVAGGRPRTGSPKYYPGTTTTELNSAFQSIRDSVAKCTYITPSAPTDADSIQVVVNGKSVARDATHAQGWDWIDQAYGVLQLFGTACDDATSSNVSGTIQCRDD